MQNASKLNDNHEYAKILQEKCKNKDLRFQTKSIFLRHLQGSCACMEIGFELASLQWMSSNGLVLRFAPEFASMHDFSFTLFGNFFKFAFDDSAASHLLSHVLWLV